MKSDERRLVLDQLVSSEARLLRLVEDLTLEQWNFQETPERWSIAGIIEHLILFENFIIDSFRINLGPHAFQFLGDGLQLFLQGVAVMLTYWLMLFWMYRRKLFLRI